VLGRIAAGQDTQQMAREMNIAISTLRSYVKNVFAKLGAHSRLEAAAVASQASLPAEILAARSPWRRDEKGLLHSA
jgi:two-component system, NarL family, nitrate/nitrite response regulator NarL